MIPRRLICTLPKKRIRDYTREYALSKERGDQEYRVRVNRDRNKANAKANRKKNPVGKDISHAKSRGVGKATMASTSKNRSQGGKAGNRKNKGKRGAS